MDDDFGTPEAIAELHQLRNRFFHASDKRAVPQLKALGAVLGLLQRDPEEFLQGRALAARLEARPSIKGELTTELFLKGLSRSVEQLIRERKEARKRKDFKEADRIRKELLDHGIVLEDKGGETSWRRV